MFIYNINSATLHMIDVEDGNPVWSIDWLDGRLLSSIVDCSKHHRDRFSFVRDNDGKPDFLQTILLERYTLPDDIEILLDHLKELDVPA